MRKPNESLDDFVVKAVIEKSAEPPRRVSLRSTGEVEVLKPLARWEGPAKPNSAIVDTHLRPAPHRLSWFHRSLAVGGGLAIIAFIFVSAILVAIYDPPTEPAESAASQIETAADPIAIHGQPLTSDIFTTASSQPASDELHAVRSIATPRRARVRRNPRRSQLSKFVPTTLVIYAENGEIKTRIEPQLIAAYKKQLTLSN